jgi:hypothetical protein
VVLPAKQETNQTLEKSHGKDEKAKGDSEFKDMLIIEDTVTPEVAVKVPKAHIEIVAIALLQADYKRARFFCQLMDQRRR